MLVTRFLSITGTFAAVAIAVLLGLGPAWAGTIYRGVFDPSGFGGTVFVDAPASCDLTTGWIAAGPSNCGQVDITSLVVQSPPPPTSPVDSITFAPPTIPNSITGLWWENGVLSGIDSISLFAAGSGGTYFSANYYELVFSSGHANFQVPVSPTVSLTACSTFGCDGGDVNLVGTASQEPFVRVPEPSALSLVLGALAAGWLARRRASAA